MPIDDNVSDRFEDFEDYEERTYFLDCTCEHDPGEHGWGHCDVPGCPCEGGWEE